MRSTSAKLTALARCPFPLVFLLGKVPSYMMQGCNGCTMVQVVNVEWVG
jgi:hypothetical protein